VAEENRQLRGLLNRHGITEDEIYRYLHTSGAAAQTDPTPIPHVTSSNPSDAVQSLQHVIAPWRPTTLDPGDSCVVPPQESREISIASALKSSSSLWEPGPAYQRDPANDQQFPCNVPPLTLPVPPDMNQQRQCFPVVPVTQAPLTRTHDSGATSELSLDHSPSLESEVWKALMESCGYLAGRC
jgi:hypothetical protein